MLFTFQRMMKDQSGATAIEYGLIAALIGAALVAGLPTLTGALSTLWSDIALNLKMKE